jgi:squalene-hopene/tetraprenyl-beta-curcumene cyclase
LCQSFFDVMLNLLALDTLGHGPGTAAYDRCHDRLQELVVHDDRRNQVWPQLHTSALADSALALRSLHASGISLRQLLGPTATTWLARPRLDATVDNIQAAWLLETLRATDDELTDLDASLPPDIQLESNTGIDVTAIRDAALRKRARRVANEFVLKIFDRQNADGGWAPTADGGSSSAPDVTGAVLQSLADCGGARARRALVRAVDYLRAAQRADGSWNSATGVQFVHGTSMAVCGLLAAGVLAEDEAIAAGVNWLIVHQQPSGGWGELPPDDRQMATDYKVVGPTPSQTAWAVLALVAAGLSGEESTRRGIRFLLDMQADDGGWGESNFTLRDSRSGRWFKCGLQAAAWSLFALSRWSVAAAVENRRAEQPSLRLVGLSDD